MNTGSQFTSFLLGAVDSGDVSDVLSPSYFRISRYVLTAADTWELAPGLTLSFGLTFELQSPRIEKYNRQSTVDLNAVNPADGLPGALIFAGLNGAPTGFQPYIGRGDPSASVAWSPGANRKSVLRASYARSYQEPRSMAPSGAPRVSMACRPLPRPIRNSHPPFSWLAACRPPARSPICAPAPPTAPTRLSSKARARPPSTSPPASPMNARCPSRSSSRSALAPPGGMTSSSGQPGRQPQRHFAQRPAVRRALRRSQFP